MKVIVLQHLLTHDVLCIYRLESITEKSSDLSKMCVRTTRPCIETDGTYEAVATRWPPAASLAAESLQKPPCCGRLNIGVMEIACGMWDER